MAGRVEEFRGNDDLRSRRPDDAEAPAGDDQGSGDSSPVRPLFLLRRRPFRPQIGNAASVVERHHPFPLKVVDELAQGVEFLPVLDVDMPRKLLEGDARSRIAREEGEYAFLQSSDFRVSRLK
jgi:hypothetical protein